MIGSVLMVMFLLVVCCGRSQRQFNSKAAALARETAGFDLPVMGHADGFDDRQAQSGAAQFARTGGIDAKEPVENPRQRFGWNPDAIVRDLQHGFAVVRADGQSNGPALESV